MTNSRKLLTSLILLALLLPGSCAASSLRELRKIFKSIGTMSAHFEQTLTAPNGRVIRRISGDMALKKPGKFRWRTQKPSRQLIIADGKRVWHYNQDLAQVIVQQQRGSAAITPASLLSTSAHRLGRYFEVSKAKDHFVLTSRRRDMAFKGMQLYFKRNRLVRMRLLDPMDQIADLKFSQVKVNANLKPQLFQFSPPRGIDVIKN